VSLAGSSAGLAARPCLVVGATSGIGLATAECLADSGVPLVVCAREAARCEAVARRLSARADVRAWPGDMRSPGDMQRAADEAERRFGSLELAFINAGQILGAGALCETDPESAREAFELNALGVLNVLRAVIPKMAAAGGGAIVINSALSGLRPRSPIGAYSAAKAAAISLAEVAAIEAGPSGVRVNVIAPGYVASDAWMAKLGSQSDALAGTVPLRRIGRPDEVASVVKWLLSEQSAYVHGAVIPVDGGLRLV
jgi:NAD(P)-dependent dehydrogenase (short-subunit alcohol dehydrogenase family)